MGQVVVFQVEARRFGLPLAVVERVVRAVELTDLPNAPDIVLGVINVQGRIIPVVDLRRRLRLPPRANILADQLLIARTEARPLALMVDGVATVAEYDPTDFTEAAAVAPGLDYLAGLVRLPDGILLVHDLEQFLSLQEARALDEALGDA